MLKSRIIPCLLIHNGGLVKSFNFKNYKYVGDPLNAIKIFNEKKCDELLLLDIDASVKKTLPNYTLLKKVANESRMPVCYGGGIKTVDQASKIINLGIEKVSLSSVIHADANIIKNVSKKIGAQSTIATIDVMKNIFGKYEIFINNGKVKVKKNLINLIDELQELGVGEIVINDIHRDGTMKGYDFKLIDYIRSKLKVPLSVIGGVSDLNNIKECIKRFGPIGCGVGSLFVFKGKYKAVLISYPDKKEKNYILNVN